MPTYEYKCDACGHEFERFQPITSEPIKRCPQCGKAKVRRLISAGAGMIFKGSGFYITDYRDKSYTHKAKAEAGSTSSGENKSSESKPAESSAPAKTETSKTDSAPKSESKSESKSK